MDKTDKKVYEMKDLVELLPFGKRGLVNLLNNYKKWGKNGVKNEGEDSESSVKQ